MDVNLVNVIVHACCCISAAVSVVRVPEGPLFYLPSPIQQLLRMGTLKTVLGLGGVPQSGVSIVPAPWLYLTMVSLLQSRIWIIVGLKKIIIR